MFVFSTGSNIFLFRKIYLFIRHHENQSTLDKLLQLDHMIESMILMQVREETLGKQQQYTNYQKKLLPYNNLGNFHHDKLDLLCRNECTDYFMVFERVFLVSLSFPQMLDYSPLCRGCKIVQERWCVDALLGFKTHFMSEEGMFCCTF